MFVHLIANVERHNKHTLQKMGICIMGVGQTGKGASTVKSKADYMTNPVYWFHIVFYYLRIIGWFIHSRVFRLLQLKLMCLITGLLLDARYYISLVVPFSCCCPTFCTFNLVCIIPILRVTELEFVQNPILKNKTKKKQDMETIGDFFFKHTLDVRYICINKLNIVEKSKTNLIKKHNCNVSCTMLLLYAPDWI